MDIHYVIYLEIKQNPLFDQSEYERCKKLPVPNFKAPDIPYELIQPQTAQPQNVPKCPTCQSTNLRKISDLKRATHGIAFGFISKTAWSQFECKNCGYKW